MIELTPAEAAETLEALEPVFTREAAAAWRLFDSQELRRSLARYTSPPGNWETWQLRDLLARLKPPAAKRDACGAHIIEVLEAAAKARRVAAEYQHKAKASRALDRALQGALVVARTIAGNSSVSVPSPAEIERLLDMHKEWEAYWRPLLPKEVKRIAVILGRELLSDWQPDQKVVTTKGGNWWHAARIVYGKRIGEPGADLRRQILAFERERHPPTRRGRK